MKLPPPRLFFSFPFIALPILAVLFQGVESQEVYGKYRNRATSRDQWSFQTIQPF